MCIRDRNTSTYSPPEDGSRQPTRFSEASRRELAETENLLRVETQHAAPDEAGVCALFRVQCSLEEFIDRWAQHIPERYQHAVRSFGLFGPRALRQTSAAIFAILGQQRKPRPKPRRWADSLKRDFGHDPLLDETGERMKWVRRLQPTVSR